MTEVHITLYGDSAEAFEAVKDDMGPTGVDLSNPDVVRRLIEDYETGVRGGLTDIDG